MNPRPRRLQRLVVGSPAPNVAMWASVRSGKEAPQGSGRSRTTSADAFVVPQAEEARLTQPMFARPFGEPDLCDELRPRPMCSEAEPAGRRRTVTRAFQCAQLPAELA